MQDRREEAGSHNRRICGTLTASLAKLILHKRGNFALVDTPARGRYVPSVVLRIVLAAVAVRILTSFYLPSVVYPDETFEVEVMAFCRHLALQNAELVGTAKVAIELAADLGVHQAASVERLANSALMLNPAYLEGVAKYVQGIGKGGKKD